MLLRSRSGREAKALRLIQGRDQAELDRATGWSRSWRLVLIGLTALLLCCLAELLQHLLACPGVAPQLFFLHLTRQMHLLFHGQQHGTTVDQALHSRMKAGSVGLR